MSLNPDPDPDHMTKKKFDQKSSQKDIQALGEASSPTENFLNIKFLYFFLNWGTILACLDLDPLVQLNPESKHWLPFFVEKNSHHFAGSRIKSRLI
jgi:hypothetical protein